MPIVQFLTADGRRVLVNVRRQATSVLVNDELALNYDVEGRLTGAWMDGRNYLRTLDNRILEKQVGTKPGLSYRVRSELDRDETHRLFDRVHGLLAGFHADICNPASRVVNDAGEAETQTARKALERVLTWDFERLERERQEFQRIYKPINILPPDQYLSLVLQATEGCSYNQCAFCGFYRDRSFHVKTLSEFQQHVYAVRGFFGPAINLRKSIFLADANALVMPQEQLLPIFAVINDQFAVEPRGLSKAARAAWRAEHPIYFEGIYSFIDAFTSRRKTGDEIAALGARGLRRVYIGMESGDAGLLQFLGKPNSPEDVLNLVQQVKAGGVGVGVVILAGAGGEQFSAQHVNQTVELVNAMPLDGQDIIYLSELVDYPGSEYSALAEKAGIRLLSIPEVEAQMAQMRQGFHLPQTNAPKVSYYDVREFLY